MSPIEVRSQGPGGAPLWVRLEGSWVAVASLIQHWRVEVGWWRTEPGRPVSRDCWRVLLAGGACLDLRRNLRSGAWELERLWG